MIKNMVRTSAHLDYNHHNGKSMLLNHLKNNGSFSMFVAAYECWSLDPLQAKHFTQQIRNSIAHR